MIKIRDNSGVLDDLHFRVVEMYNRLFEIEKEIKSFAEIHFDLEEEYNRIFSEVSKIINTIDNNPDAKIKLEELDVWLVNLEEKVFS